jgi:HEAT repeat protein
MNASSAGQRSSLHPFLACCLLAALLTAGPMGSAVHAQAKKAKGTPAAAAIESHYDKIVDDFIAFDIGQMTGEEGQRAHAAFQNMNDDEAIPALIRGMNKAARIENSCPVIVIGNKLNSMLASSKNPRHLRAAVKELDSSGPNVYFAGMVESLRQAADQMLSTMTNTKPTITREVRLGSPSALRRSQSPAEKWTLDDIVDGIGVENGAELVRLLEQLQIRKGSEYTAALTKAIDTVSDENKPLVRGLLAQRLARMTDQTLRKALKDPNSEIRAAAARAVGYKGSPVCEELAMAVGDGNRMVAENAHTALVKLTGEDIGPEKDASAAERFEAGRKWAKAIAEREQAAPEGK